MTTAQDLLTELARVADATGRAVVPASSDELLDALTETARQLFGAQACSLALLSDDESELVYTVASGTGAEDVTGMRLPSGAGVAGWVVQSGQPVSVTDAAQDPRFASDVAETTGYVPGSLLAAPVTSSSGALGVLTVLDRDDTRPGAAYDLQLLQLFCDQAAIALEASRVFGRAGRVLLDALASAAGEGTPLAEALAATVPPAPDARLHELATLLAELAQAPRDAQGLAVRVLREVLAFSTGGAPRPV